MNEFAKIHVLPRKTMSWEEFFKMAPNNSIALDGIVSGGPRFDEKERKINFDHHDGVIREATMCTAMQVFIAIKGGLMDLYRENGKPLMHIFINDTDQDTSLAVWFLCNYDKFEGTLSSPSMNRLLDLTNKWDITGGAFPIAVREKRLRQYGWVFEPYTSLRKSGKLADADENILKNNLEAILSRLDKYYVGDVEEKELDIRYEILYDSPNFKFIDEIGGNDARSYLFNHGMKSFVSLVARRDDGHLVYSLGKRSKFIPFPVTTLYDDLNKAEGIPLDSNNRWGGSDIVGGSPRETGSKLTWEKIVEIINKLSLIHI